MRSEAAVRESVMRESAEVADRGEAPWAGHDRPSEDDPRRRRAQHAGPGIDDRASLDGDAREIRLERVAVLYEQITAATRAFLAAVAECDRHRDWAALGFGSCAEWLAWRVGLQRNAASERVRVARALEELPETSAAMARGELPFSKVRALTRVATADDEAELLDFARASSAADLERIVRAWKTLDREDEAKRERRLHRSRRFSIVPDGDGMYVVRGRLMPEVAAVLMRAVDAASDVLYHEARRPEAARSDVHAAQRDEIEPAQRRADAIGLLAERALAMGLGGGADFEDGDDDATPISGLRAQRYQVLLHVEPETLAEEGEPGMSELEDGTRVSAETARRLACDAALVVVTEDRRTTALEPRRAERPVPTPRHPCSEHPVSAETGRRSLNHRGSPDQHSLRDRPSVLDVGRRTRTVPASLRRALEVRDRGCRFPGCGGRFADAHHIKHWADGGETKLSNLVPLCRRHHRRVHEDGWTVASDPTAGADVVFFTPNGRALAGAPPLEVPS